MASPKPLKIEDHETLRTLDTLDRNGPLTFGEICTSADVHFVAVNTDLYLEDDLGPPFNDERERGSLFRITPLGKSIIRLVRGVSDKPERTYFDRPVPTASIGGKFVRITGDPDGLSTDPPGAVCTVKSHKDSMVWYAYENQKKRWGKCSKQFCMRQDDFDANFRPET